MTELDRKVFLAQQVNRAVQLTIESADFDDTTAMEVADLYEEWAAGKRYKAQKIVRYGVNKDDEAQLYRVVQEHTSQADWTPDKTPALYTAIGIDDDGVPIWTQPLGGHDAYAKGDRVHYPDKGDPIYVSLVDGNVYAPNTYWWELE